MKRCLSAKHFCVILCNLLYTTRRYIYINIFFWTKNCWYHQQSPRLMWSIILHDPGMTMSIPTWTKQGKHQCLVTSTIQNWNHQALAHPVTTIGCLVFLMVFFVFLRVPLLGLFKAACVTMCQTRHAWPKRSVWQTPNLCNGEIVSAVPKGRFVHTHDRWNMMESHPQFCLWVSDWKPIWSKVDKVLEDHRNPNLLQQRRTEKHTHFRKGRTLFWLAFAGVCFWAKRLHAHVILSWEGQAHAWAMWGWHARLNPVGKEFSNALSPAGHDLPPRFTKV